METERRILQPVADAPREIGFYLSGWEKVRAGLRATVADLSKAELAARITPDAHQIGNLILHLGEAEAHWIHSVVAERELSEDEKKFAHIYDTTETDFAGKNYTAAECIERIDALSRRSREILTNFADEDLEKTFGYDRDGKRIEVSLRWVLIDLAEHEAVHKGQISMIKRLLREGEFTQNK